MEYQPFPSTAPVSNGEATLDLKTLGFGNQAGTLYVRVKAAPGRNASAAASGVFTVATVTPSNAIPVANAGADTTITLPTSSGSITGSGTDTDGTIVSWAWSQVGTTPSVLTLTNANTNTVSYSGATTAGTYTLQLVVTDNQGAQSVADTVNITVLAEPSGEVKTQLYSYTFDDVTGAGGGTYSVGAVSGTTLPQQDTSASRILVDTRTTPYRLWMTAPITQNAYVNWVLPTFAGWAVGDNIRVTLDMQVSSGVVKVYADNARLLPDLTVAPSGLRVIDFTVTNGTGYIFALEVNAQDSTADTVDCECYVRSLKVEKIG